MNCSNTNSITKELVSTKNNERIGTSKRMAKHAKDLVDEKGILSTPNTKVSKSLPDATVQLMQDFYSSDEVEQCLVKRIMYQ